MTVQPKRTISHRPAVRSCPRCGRDHFAELSSLERAEREEGVIKPVLLAEARHLARELAIGLDIQDS